MGKFLITEKRYQAQFKQTSPYFSADARLDGQYGKKAYEFCLPAACASENLYEAIRIPAIKYFTENKITWHKGIGKYPTNHLCSSQVCCINFLFPFANQPEALTALLRPLFPTIKTVLPIDGQFVAFEWIGEQNYLKERSPKNGQRIRGANSTSADAAVYLQHADGTRQIVLIEWKYTESYSPASYATAKSGTDRIKIYQHLYDNPACLLEKSKVTDFAALFYEPFYQFMRQQFLAYEMQKAHELGADIVSVLHICPAQNSDFRRVTSPKLQVYGDTATSVWQSLLKQPDSFMSVTTNTLFHQLHLQELPALHDWWIYIHARYPWLGLPA